MNANIRLSALFKGDLRMKVFAAYAEVSEMRELAIVAPCIHPSVACWGAEHRCYQLRYEYISLVAERVFGSDGLSEGWMRTPKLGFGDKPPCLLLTKTPGYAVLYDWLMRIEHGILT